MFQWGIRQTAGECKSKKRLDGKVVIITGANTGIGKETAIDLARRGAKVISACRDMEKANQAVIDIKSSSNSDLVRAEKLDLASIASIKKFAEKFLKDEPKLDILINNAGVMMCPKQKTVDGFEMQFGVNHLGPFLLTSLLLPRLLESESAKIINVSSTAHNRKCELYIIINF